MYRTNIEWGHKQESILYAYHYRTTYVPGVKGSTDDEEKVFAAISLSVRIAHFPTLSLGIEGTFDLGVKGQTDEQLVNFSHMTSTHILIGCLHGCYEPSVHTSKS